MRRLVLLGLLGFSIVIANACNPPERDFTPNENAGGEGNGNASGGRASSSGDGDGDQTTSSGDGDGDTSSGDGDGDTSSGDGDGDSTTGGDGDGDGDGESCGDGVQASGEDCDDGNSDDEDGCSSDCEVEEGWFCGEPDTDCVDCSGDDPVLGCPCTKIDEEVCAGAHQKERLKCDGTTWQGLADCDGDDLCESDSGECLPVIAECESTSDGFQFCEDTNIRHTCGPDWVTTEQITCVGACENGKCVAPDCGDGVLQPETEACDDGNLNPNDGCDDQCVRTPGWYCPEANQACINCSGGPSLDCPCVDSDYPSGGYSGGDKACNGAAQKLSLECDNSTELWVTGPVCSAGQNCEQATGECKTIVSQCSGQSGGHTYCTGNSSPLDVRNVCDADLVNVTSTTCSGVCSGGACQVARCGDGKIQSGEACDDGNNTPADGCEPASSSAPCQESGVVKVEAGLGLTCALLRGGHVRCWGDNTANQLGQGNTNSYSSLHPSEIPLLDLGGVATDVQLGNNFSCALLESGKVQCWGNNTLGELGQGTSTAHLNERPSAIGPVELSANAKAISIAPSSSMACALLTNDQVQCWGQNALGALGIGSTDPLIGLSSPPTSYGTVNLGTTALAVQSFYRGGCAYLSNGGVRCWGFNTSGQLGLGHENPVGYDAPVFPNQTNGAGNVNLGSLVVARLILGSSSACVVLDTGKARCWGENGVYQLGIPGSTHDLGSASGDDIAASGIVGLGTQQRILDMSLGYNHSCAVIEDPPGSHLKCWGGNSSMERGYGTSAPTAGLTPVGYAAVSISPVASVSAGAGHTCALLNSGDVKCWGGNTTGQLGLSYTSNHTGNTLPSELPAVQVF